MSGVLAASIRQIKLVGLVMDLGRKLIELGAVSACMVSAEQELTAAGEHHAYICLGATAVTTVYRSKDWSRCGNGTCHAYLQQLVVGFRSERRLALG